MRVRIWMLLAVILCAACDQLGSTGAGTCGDTTSYAVGTSQAGKVEQGDCSVPGVPMLDTYIFHTSQVTALQFSLGSFKGGLSLFKGATVPPNIDSEIFNIEGGGSARAFLPAGIYTILVGGDAPGSYTFSTTETNAAGCTDKYTTTGIFLSGGVNVDDCAANGGAKQDMFQINMTAGQTIGVNATLVKQGAVAFGNDKNPEMFSKQFDSPTGGTAQFAFTAPTAGYYTLHLFGMPAQFGVSGYGFGIQ
jgi:hypothetical protein